MARMNMSLCELPFEMHNISNLSGICDPSAPPSGGLPHSIMTIIQIFYGLICLLGLIGIILHSKTEKFVTALTTLLIIIIE